MENLDQNREIRLEQLLVIIKLSILFFSAIACFQHYFDGKNITDLLAGNNLTFIVFLIVLMIIYLALTLSNFIESVKQSGPFKYGELIFFGLLAFLTVFFTGAIDSNFKPLMLCVILLATIGQGLIIGMITSFALSGSLLIMDLLMSQNQVVNLYFEYDLILASIFLLVTFTVGYYAKMENEHIKELRDLANIDSLTGLFNHRYFYANLDMQIKEAETKENSVSLLFLDIDDFKIYNNLYGHACGDEALKKLAQIITGNLDNRHIACRYGGEEFSILMGGSDEKTAIEYAQNLREQIEETVFYGEAYMPEGKLTMSVGISEYPHKAKNGKDLVTQADEALYRAKFFRKNRVESYVSILDNLKDSLSGEDESIITTLRTLISVINSRDKWTYEHVERVAEYAGWMADKLGFTKESRQTLVYGAYMHDIGKINTPKEVLIKSDKLTLEEWEELKRHPIQGVEIIEHVDVIKDVQGLILQHHEHYNGDGYPHGLKGNEISFMSRILSVVDAFDAMTSIRPYQKKKTIEEACEELIRCRGTQFDPILVDSFVEIVTEKFNL